MSTTSSKKAPIDRAIAFIKQEAGTDAEKTSVTRTTREAMQKSPDWSAADKVQTAVVGWVQKADDLEANAALIANLRAQLEVAEAKQETLRRDWTAAKKEVTSSVTAFCQGSADKVKGFHLDVVTYRKRVLLDAPEGLEVNPGAWPGDVRAKWLRGLARNGFVVQHATNPSDPATISAAISWTKVSFKLDGLPPGTAVSFRIAAVDPKSPTGISPWSAWVLGNAR
jgi:hypothetical protein